MLGIVADFDLRVGEFSQLLYGFHIGSTHIGGGDDPQRAAVLGEFRQLVHDQTEPAPLDKGHQHVYPVAADDLLLEFRIHLRLVYGSGKEGALGDGGFRANDLRFFIQSTDRILSFQQCQQLLCPFRNGQLLKISLLSLFDHSGNDPIYQLDLLIEIPTTILDVVQPFFNNLRNILGQDLCRFRLINARCLAELVRLGKLSIQGFIDDLFI